MYEIDIAIVRLRYCMKAKKCSINAIIAHDFIAQPKLLRPNWNMQLQKY